MPLIVSGRAVNLLAKPIDNVQVAADFNSVMATLRARGLRLAGNVMRYYLKHDGVRVAEIVAITFTDRAAREMRERIDGRIAREIAAPGPY